MLNPGGGCFGLEDEDDDVSPDNPGGGFEDVENEDVCVLLNAAVIEPNVVAAAAEGPA